MGSRLTNGEAMRAPHRRNRTTSHFDDTVADESRSFVSLFYGPMPNPDRIFHHNVWFRGAHNNMRYDASASRAFADR